MTTLSRRKFIKKTAIAGGAIGFPAIVPSSVFGKNNEVPPSERVNIGMIGCGNITKYAHQRYIHNPQSQLIAVCDPIRQRRVEKMNAVNQLYSELNGEAQYNGCKAYNDFRDLLDNPDIDGVYIATGDYWHVPMSILAAKAGKDLHTEKPLALCIDECLAMEKAVRKYNRVFQYGAEARSFMHTRMALQLVLNGHIGEVKKIYAWCHPGRAGKTPDLQPVPDGFDYDLWLGPAPKVPFDANRSMCQGPGNGIFHIYDYSIGFIAGWGAHPIDMIQWWADRTRRGIPVTYEGTGSIPTEGLFNTITHWDMTCTYQDGLPLRFTDATAIKEVVEKEEGITDLPEWYHGVLFIGTDGRRLYLRRNEFKTDPFEIMRKAKDPGDIRLPESKEHESNWIDAMISRKDPISDIHSAAQSDMLCHLCDIAIRTDSKIKWSPEKKTILENKTAKGMMSRKYRKPWSIEV